MTMRYVALDDALADYVTGHANPSTDPVGEQLAATTRERFGDLAGMNIGPDQGRFLSMLVAISGASTVVEVGTFTGMSALWMARGLADGGRLICFDISDEYAETAREAWRAAGVDDRIELRIGPAGAGLAALPLEPHVDLAFVDADKGGYRDYLDLLLPRLGDRGVIVFDNVLWTGDVVDPDEHDRDGIAIGEFNDHVAARDDVEAVMLAIGDGVTLVRRR